MPRSRAPAIFLALVPTLLLSSHAAAQDARRPKKLIATGWDMPDTRRLRDNLEIMEQRPFDGVVLEAVGRKAAGKPCRLGWAFLNEKWQRAWFQPCIDDLRACKFRRFTDNFIMLNANPGNVDWFDDEGWQNIVEHCRIAAWVAKQSGIKGLLFDPEPYAQPHSQFSYAAQPQHERHTFAEYCAQARLRGRQMMRAMAEEYPNLTLFCYFIDSINAPATGQADPRRMLSTSGYGLYPAMVDGWLDALPPTVTLVDGCESAYRYNSRQPYVEAAVQIKGDCQDLVSPENRAKYRTAVQVSFGIYLDAYWNPKESPWYIGAEDGNRVRRLRANTQTALRVADEYVWVYGEKFRWWPTPNQRVQAQTWPEALPGCDAALGFARDPVGYARTEIARLKKSSKAASLAGNGDFAAETVTVDGREEKWQKDGRPAGWSAWQEATSHGKFTWDRDTGRAGKGSARAAGVSGGCFLQAHDVKPGQPYAARAFRRLQGKGNAWMRIRWQTADGRWTAEGQDQLFFCDGPPENWGEMFGVVEVPEDVGKLVILLCVSGQASADDIAWFDDVELYRLP
jgi:hypothetical protein